METPYSRLDEVIDEGISALRDANLDTSRMASVLSPRSKRSIVWPVGLATAVACAAGAIILLTPTKADAGEFEKVKKAVKCQPAVYEKVLQRGKDQTWEVRVETFVDGDKRAVKWAPAQGGYQYIVKDGKKYEKWPDKKEVTVSFVAEVLVEGQHYNAGISEILAREGMEFISVKRMQKKEGRACDIYRVNFQKEPNDILYYVDPKTDLPFLQEVVRDDGFVLDRVEIDFPGTMRFRLVGEDGGEVKFQVAARLGLVKTEGVFIVDGPKGEKPMLELELKVEGKPISVPPKK